jgi:twitching motility two-component system response regulator PilH
VLGWRESRKPGSAPQAADARSKLPRASSDACTIVLIDDDYITLRLFEGMLSKEGYRVRSFLSAEEALEYLCTEIPDLIISDIVMPDMDGYQLKQSYSHLFPERTTPFIFVTGLGRETDRAIAMSYGVDDYLVKPVRRDEMIAKVRFLIGIE